VRKSGSGKRKRAAEKPLFAKGEGGKAGGQKDRGQENGWQKNAD
jgi:hypothetical protein